MESWNGQGLAIRDYFNGDKEAGIIIHSSDGDTEEVEVSIFFREFPYIPLIEKAALDLCYGDVIDVGAGAGCHSLELQNRGMNVAAIDVLPDVVDIMKARGVRDARLGDFWELKDERFDTVLMLMNGIGIVGDLEGLKVFLGRAGRSFLIPLTCDVKNRKARRMVLRNLKAFQGTARRRGDISERSNTG